MKLLDKEIDVEGNKRLLFTKHRDYFHWLVLSAFLDVVSTWWFMVVVGPHIEMNVVVRLLSYSYGIIIGPLLGKSVQLFAVWAFSVITPRLTRFICLVIIGVNLMACFMNTWVAIINL